MSELILGPGHSWKPPIPRREQQIIIFDSPDGTGKTTIAQGLAMDMKLPYYKPQYEKKLWRAGGDSFMNELRHGEIRELEIVRQLKLSVIKDRGYPSEWVYSRVFDRPTDDEVLEQVDVAFARMGAYIVIPVRHDYSKARDDDLVERKHLPLLHETYMEFAQWTRCTTIMLYVDAFDDDLKREVEALKDELKFGDELSWRWNKVLGGELPKGRDIADIFQRERTQADAKGAELKARR